MSSVSSLRNRFENISLPEDTLTTTQRVQVKKYGMPLRQSTLSFGSLATQGQSQKSQNMASTTVRSGIQSLTPPADESEGDTIIVSTSMSSSRVPLPTPSESATDMSSEASGTPKRKSIPRGRSKRVTKTPKSAAKDSHIPSPPRQEEPATEKQRNISGETLVPEANLSQTSLLKDSIDALDMKWDMDVQFNGKEATQEVEVQSDASSTITVTPTAIPTVEDNKSIETEQKKEAKRVKMAENEKKWEQRRSRAEQDATRRSSRASLLINKATEVVSEITSTVLGKRARKDQTGASMEPDNKKARLSKSSSVPPQGNENQSLAATNRAMRSRAPKDKRWLISGLYAGQSRTFNPSFTESKNKRKSSTTPEDATSNGSDNSTLPPPKENSVLPLPMYAGERLLNTGRDFKLPFDIFSPLPVGQPKPDEWRKVNKNVFVGSAADEWRSISKSMLSILNVCACDTAADSCDDDCLNRMMYYECDTQNCTSCIDGLNCGNTPFAGLRERVKEGGKYNIGVEVMRTSDRGYGVRANRTFEPRQIIVEYTGEIINQEECERRMRTDYKDNECYYLMAFDQNMIIDATRGSLARFVNHSCDPNCRMEKWTVAGKPRMALFAGDRGIMTGEELTYDYNFDPYSAKNVQVCKCGSDNCRGVLGPKPKEQMLKEKMGAVGMVGGMKRKIEQVLEESKEALLNKKRKVELPKLPKGWAYIEPEPKVKKQQKKKTEETEKENVDVPGTVSRQPSKLKKSTSETSAGKNSVSLGAKARGKSRVVSSSSTKALIDAEETVVFENEKVAGPATNSMKANEVAPASSSSSFSNLKEKAEGLKRSMSKSLRGRK